MKEQKEWKVFSGEIVWKSFFEHFKPPQWLYGSPYHYIVKYDDYAGGTPERRYGLWKFNMDTLTYELYQTSGEKDSKTLHDIADQWQKDEWAARKRKQEEEEEAYSKMIEEKMQKRS